ncbi:unnamed protein product, partial [marine sediment metagenome]
MIASGSASEAYLTAKQFTASPGLAAKEIYDMAIRTAQQAVRALELGDPELATIRLHKSLELLGWLERAGAGRPEGRGACGDALREARRWMVEAIHYRQREAIVAAIRLLTEPCDAWDEFLERFSERSA